jgi:hypothetical protein
MMAEKPANPSTSRLPSLHVARAALHVALIVDQRGSRSADAQESYWHHATGGSFAPVDLDRGERLLLDVGLLVERDGQLTPTPHLAQLVQGSPADALVVLIQRLLALTGPVELEAPAGIAAQVAELIPDAARREELLLALAQRFDDTRQRLVGEIGEELVVNAARTELRNMGRPDLAQEVRRVSLLSDQLGYDVSAPRVTGAPRLLEVKATTADSDGRSVAIHLSRNEADTGTTLPDWALVACQVENTDQRQGHIVGWCTCHALADLLPSDCLTGRWEQASLALPLDRLSPGLPGVAV